MKVLVFSPYYPPHTGGLETHSDEFNRYLSQKGIDIIVFAPRLPVTTPKKEILYGKVHVIRYPAFNVISNYPLPKFWNLEFWQQFFSLFQNDFDIVISRTRFFFSSFLALIYAKIQQKKLVHIEHGSDFVKLSSHLKTAIAKFYDYTFGWLVFRCADINISISEVVQKFVLTFDKRLSPVIYRGLDFDQIDAIEPDFEIRKQFPDKLIAATAARLYKWKGIENSINAIEKLPENIKSKIIFIIIGDGEDFSRLKKMSGNLIRMLGGLSREKTLAILKTSDIFIHSSLPGGGLSTSLLEAMYCQCAIIATPNEGADEVINNEKNGLLIAESTPEMIQTALTKLIENKELREELAQQAKQDVRDKFSWEKSIDSYLDILETIA